MSKEVDKDFAERMRQAAAHAKIAEDAYTPQKVGTLLGVDRRKAAVWISGSLPRADRLFSIAERFGVNPKWFATGKGEMVPKPQAESDLNTEEATILALYRDADPRWRLSLRLLAHVATEEQLEAATDVNMVMARIFGKRPKDVRPFSDKYVASKLPEAPHVTARKKREREEK
jgi:hypothetical protein